MLKKSVLTLSALLMSSVVMAEDTLNAAEVKELFTNHTFDVHNVAKDKNVQVYDTGDGDHYVYVPWKDKTFTRKWWIEGDKHCTSHPKRGDSCKVMKKMGDGVYHGITNGTHSHTLSNFRSGESFNK